jgi:hypothetical protein
MADESENQYKWVASSIGWQTRARPTAHTGWVDGIQRASFSSASDQVEVQNTCIPNDAAGPRSIMGLELFLQQVSLLHRDDQSLLFAC